MDHIYILSLESRPDRREILSLELIQHGLLEKTTFIKAHTPQSPLVAYLSGGLNLNWIRSHGSPLGYELSCLASHIEALRIIVTKNEPGILFEDDAILHKDFVHRWGLIKEQITDQELIYLGCHGATPSDLTETKIVKREGIVWGTVSYWVTPDRAKKMLDSYCKPMTEYGLRTSECISLLGDSYQTSPLLVIEEPRGISSLRPSQFSSLTLDDFRLWGLENYGGEYRNNPIDKLPFIMLMVKLLGETTDEEKNEIQLALRPYLCQPSFCVLQERYKKG